MEIITNSIIPPILSLKSNSNINKQKSPKYITAKLLQLSDNYQKCKIKHEQALPSIMPEYTIKDSQIKESIKYMNEHISTKRKNSKIQDIKYQRQQLIAAAYNINNKIDST